MGSFNSFADFIAMGGSATYVWSAYGFFAIILIFNIGQPLVARKKYIQQQIKRQQVQEERDLAQKQQQEQQQQ